MESPIPPQEMTLDELRVALAPLVAQNVVFDGWSERALDSAAETLGIPPSRAKLAFPGGPVDMIDAWFRWIDQRLETTCPAASLSGLKIRERIRTMVLARLALADKEAARRALAVLALPTNLVRAARLGWRTADMMWRLAGDTATDFSHYSKRMTLAAVYGSTLMIWLNDESPEAQDTRAFLDRRIDGVMRFERAKARFRSDPERRFNPALFLGRLRYPDA